MSHCGTCGTDPHRADTLIPAVALSKEADLRFSIVYDVDEFHQSIEALDAGDVAPRRMITDTVALAEGPAAFEALRHRTNQCKVMITPWL